MKTIIKTVVTGCFLLAAFAACETEKTMTFASADCVYFAAAADTSRFSFGALKDPHVESNVFTIEVALAGSPAAHDRPFDVGVIKDARNPRTRYEIVSPSLVKAGAATGIIEVKVWQTPNLDITRDTVTIELRPSGELIADMVGKTTRCMTFYNKLDRPAWWTAIYLYSLGKFHEIKLEVMMAVLGSLDDPTANSYRWPYYQFLLNDYCDRNNLTYPEDGTRVRFAYGF